MKPFITKWAGVFSFLSTVTAGFAADPLISEVMYHPTSENLMESYVELLNPGTTPINLSGFHFVKGFTFTFPTNTVLAPGAFLVVAADQATFTQKYPGIANFIAGWAPPMSSHLQLADGTGQIINDVNYSNDGDWASRVLTTNGFASFGHMGWLWSAPHDGEGSSLELINPNLSNTYGLNWGSSSTLNGTPGRANSIAKTNLPAIITSVAHSPILPGPTDVVTVSARLIDEHASGLNVSLSYRSANSATPPAFVTVPMFDDGAHNDGMGSDGIFAAILPVQPTGTVIEFYLKATDLEGNVRVYPSVIPPTSSLRTANLLYQVDDGAYSGSQPSYRLVMTELERREIYLIGRGCPDMDSDAQMNATWITHDGVTSSGTATQLRYNAGVRNRGHGSRSANPNNYHVNIPSDRSWKGQTGINLNSQRAYSQLLGSAVFSKAEMPVAQSRLVQLRINSTNLMSLPLADNNSFGSYAANEQYDSHFVDRALVSDPNGNSYRGIRQQSLCDTSLDGVADFAWHGASYAVAGYTNSYFKQNNELVNDWSDVIDLISVLNSTNGYHASNYTADVQRRVNVNEWMKFMAINTLLDNSETCLANGYGDDYALYRGVKDTRFLVLPYDQDSLMGQGLTPVIPKSSLFRMTVLSSMDRFMKTPEFAAQYYGWLKSLSDTMFSPAQMNPLLDQVVGRFVPQLNLDNMKAYNAAQVSWVLSQIPLSISISNNLAPVGTNRTTSATLALHGRANAITTRKILVNGSPATWSAWQATWTNSAVTLTPGVNRILVQSLDSNGLEVERAYSTIWYDTSAGTTVGGSIAANTTWTAAGGPYNVTSTLTVASGATLTIQPGTTLFLGSGVNLVVANGGRLLAEGTTNAPIAFTVTPGSGGSWGGIIINGAVGSPETRIANAWFQGNSTTCIEVAAGTLSLDQCTFLTTSHQYVALNGSSFLISGCYFPSASATFELLHGTGGIKSGGRGIVRDCFFGTAIGYNDIMDFTGGNRDLGQSIIQYYNNVFIGATDDILDLDGTDAWIEGNIFLHDHKNGAPDSSSAISGGDNGSDISQITIIGNIFYDCDHAATAKQQNFFSLYNNTIVHTTKTGGLDSDSAIVNVRDIADDGTPTTFGSGFYLEGNVIFDATKLVRHYDVTQGAVTFNNNILPMAWTGPGTGNTVVNPLLKYIPDLSETYFTNWQGAQVMRDWFSLLPGSPARQSGPNGVDKGGDNPFGVSLSGEPLGTTSATTATLKVDLLRSGYGMSGAGWPNGSGFTHYKWRLDSGSWSAETVTGTPITLSGLANGPHHVEAVGKNDAGFYQNDVSLGTNAMVTSSHTWTVDTTYVAPNKPTVRINEVLAQNLTTLTNGGTLPDLLELYNFGASAVDLSGMGLTGSDSTPYLFQFPTNTPLLGSGQYLLVFADKLTTAPGIHLGFAFKLSGESVMLYDKSTSGGTLLDSVTFGMQIPDLSIGRASDGTWNLCQPTFGTNNVALGLGGTHRLHINEWLADEQFMANSDFIELFNLDTKPVALSGCYLSNSEGAPALNPVAPLCFIAPNGYVTFTADASPALGADHLNFKLDPSVGTLFLSDPLLNPIDIITYGPQTTDVSQGRSPSGSDTITDFPQPTAGGPNPTPNGTTVFMTNVTTTVKGLLDITNVWKYDNSGGSTLATTWVNTSYDDSTWLSGQGLFGYETTPAVYPFPFRTTIPAPAQTGGHTTVYYRAHVTWNGSLTNYSLISTNYVDDGAAYYLNGVKMGSLNMPSTYTYSTLSSGQPSVEGVPVILNFTNKLAVGDNVVAVEVHQVATSSSDDVFGMQLNAIQLNTNIVATTNAGISVALNEILASNHTLTNADGSTADWIELHNLSTNSADISDVSLSNDPNSPRKYVVAQSTVLPADGFFLVYCNDTIPVATNNTGFALGSSGGTIFLFTSLANGGGLIDSLSYGLQTPDYSLGRVPDGTGTWQLNLPTLNQRNAAAGLGALSSLTVNEWMAAPSTGSDWFELYNSGTQPIPLGGLFLTDDLTKKTTSQIPGLSFIGCGANAFVEFFADNTPSAGANHANFALSKSGEAIGIYTAAGTPVDSVTFQGQQTDVSQGRFPDGAPTTNNFVLPSPGASNYLPLTNASINEILTHTDLPLEDAIEFYNPAASAVDISGWFLSNSADDLKKYRIPNNTVIQSHGFYVAYAAQFDPLGGQSTPFTLNSAHGDKVYLSQSDSIGNLTGYRASASFEAAANGVSFGPYTNSSGAVSFVALSARTFGVDQPVTVDQFRMGTGAPNASPLVGPVVFNEIMFYPPLNGVEDNTQDEYLELRNITSGAVPLFDPLAPTNTWHVSGGVDYSFPQGVTVPANGYVLVVNFDPVNDLLALTEFKTRYGITNAVPIYGPYTKQLSNSGEKIALYRPDAPQLAPHPDAGFVPYLLVEAISYLNAAPWPTGAGGTGQALQRRVASNMGDDQSNWFVAATTAGRANLVNPLDVNDDGLPDAWQIQYFGSITAPQAAPGMDSDGDGFSNLQEYLAGTSPVDGNSYLKLNSAVATSSGVQLRFTAIAGKTYSILASPTLTPATWIKAADVASLPQNQEVSVAITNAGVATEFYRLATP